MQIRNLLLLFILCCSACKNTKQDKTEEKFDKVKWATQQDKEYPYRDNMIKDLMASYTLSGLKKEAVMDMLGEPTRTDNGYLFYRISTQYLGNFPVPLHTRTLVIKLTKDSTVEWRKIHE